MKQAICKISDAPPEGEARVFPFSCHEVQAWRIGDHLGSAVSVCLHLGGPLECRDGAFVCPWHGARFDMIDGRSLNGPAPANARLMILPTRIEGDDLVYLGGDPS